MCVVLFPLVRQVPKYLLHVENRFNEEHSRGVAYLDPLTRRPLLEILEKQLIAAHTTPMLDKGAQQSSNCVLLRSRPGNRPFARCVS